MPLKKPENLTLNDLYTRLYNEKVQPLKQRTEKEFNEFQGLKKDAQELYKDIDELFKSINPNTTENVNYAIEEKYHIFLEKSIDEFKEHLSWAEETRKANIRAAGKGKAKERVKAIEQALSAIQLERGDFQQSIQLNQEGETIKINLYCKLAESYDLYTREQGEILSGLKNIQQGLVLEDRIKAQDTDLQTIQESIQESLENPELASVASLRDVTQEFRDTQTRLATAKEQFEEQINAIDEKAKERAEFDVELYEELINVYKKYCTSQESAEESFYILQDSLDSKDQEAASEHETTSEEQSSVSSTRSDVQSEDQILLKERHLKEANLKEELERAKINLEKLKHTESQTGDKQLSTKLSQLIEDANTFLTQNKDDLTHQLWLIDETFDQKMKIYDITQYPSRETKEEAFDAIDDEMTKERLNLLQPYLTRLSKLITDLKEIDQGVSRVGSTQDTSSSSKSSQQETKKRKIHFLGDV